MKVSASTLAVVSSSTMSGMSGNDEELFAIHSEHTCNKCLQKPILGKRYTFSSNANLCHHCVEKLPVTEIGLLMAPASLDDKKISRDCVLKLKIENGGDVQVRRMKVWQLWEDSSSNLSFEKLLSAAAGFAFHTSEINDEASETFFANATITYIDEDGDLVNISSDNELKDAFLQVLAKLPLSKPLVIKVTMPEARTTKNQIQVQRVGSSMKFVPGSMDKSSMVMGYKVKNDMKTIHSVSTGAEFDIPDDASGNHLSSARWIWWDI